jgi:hypothetical protein
LRLDRLRLLTALCVWSVAATAYAHAAPQVLQIVWNPDGKGLLLVTNRGLVFGKADADPSSWRIMCNEALHVTVSEKPSVAYLQDGRLLAGSSDGLRSTADDGCTWQDVAPFGKTSTPAIAMHPDEPNRIYVTIYGPSKGGIYVTEDGGAHFDQLMKVPDNDFIRSLLVAPGDKQILYAADSVFDAMGHYQHSVLRSKDHGASFERVEVPLLDQELDVTLLAVSPKDSGLLLARASGANPGYDPERLLVSRDGGKTFSSPLSIKTLMSAAFSADGATAWVAGLEGMWRSTDGLQSFAAVGSGQSMTYAVEHDGTLLACGYYDGLAAVLDGIGASTDSGDHYEPWMALRDIADPIACSPDAPTAAACEKPWHDWQNERALFGNGSSMVMVSGSGDAGADAGADSGAARPSDAGTGRRDAGADAAIKRGDAGSDGSLSAGGSKSSGGCGCELGRANNAGAARLTPALLFLLRYRRRRG